MAVAAVENVIRTSLPGAALPAVRWFEGSSPMGFVRADEPLVIYLNTKIPAKDLNYAIAHEAAHTVELSAGYRVSEEEAEAAAHKFAATAAPAPEPPWRPRRGTW